MQGAERPDVAERACPAVERVTAQTVLADIAKNDKDIDVREAAVGHVTEQGVLADVAKNDEDYNVREAGVNGGKYSGNHATSEGLRKAPDRKSVV